MTARGVASCLVPLFGLMAFAHAQAVPYERTFAQPKSAVEKAVQGLQSSSAGRLPILDGFVVPGDRPLDRFQRGYYQCTVQVSALPSGQSRVRVSAKVTAWYADPVAAKSEYEVLPSNGRLESDFLDRLEEALSKTAVAQTPARVAPPAKPASKSDASVPTISAPEPRDTVPGQPIVTSKTIAPSSPFKAGIPPDDELASLATRKAVTDRHIEELTKEAKNLEEILRNQSHPNNLVAIRKSGTPILVSPSEGAKVMFEATAEDEFELLDENASWVHVRISGLSRGWIRRTGVEMPEDSLSEAQASPAPSPTAPAEPSSKRPFQVENEQIASFPGDWEPLRGKTVKIISVQESIGKPSDTDSHAKLEFAKSLFDREYVELTKSSTIAAGVVVVFDSVDGGMMAATLPVLQQWKAGTLSDEALWRRCYFDPPETFQSSTP